MLQHKQSDGNREIVNQLLQELQYLEVNDLQAEHINYLMKAFQIVAESKGTDPKMA